MPTTYRSIELHLPHKYFGIPTNLTEMLFAFLAASIVSGSLVIHGSRGYYSAMIKQLLCYGKYYEPNTHLMSRLFLVPKRWFAHFYVVAVFVTSISLVLTMLRYFFDYEMPDFIHFVLDMLLGPSRIPKVSPESTLTAITLLHLQCWKRLYETRYVTVYSDAKMNFGHYAAGFIHYIGATICIVGESHGFVRDSIPAFNWTELKMIHFICSIIFFIASYEQLKTNMILANLRKDRNGVVITNRYKIPYGRLFKYISAPLQFTEIVMYSMLTIILWEASSFHFVFMWVLVNQPSTQSNCFLNGLVDMDTEIAGNSTSSKDHAGVHADDDETVNDDGLDSPRFAGGEDDYKHDDDDDYDVNDDATVDDGEDVHPSSDERSDDNDDCYHEIVRNYIIEKKEESDGNEDEYDDEDDNETGDDSEFFGMNSSTGFQFPQMSKKYLKIKDHFSSIIATSMERCMSYDAVLDIFW